MIYDLLLLLGASAQLPKWFLQKKYKGSLLQRLGFQLPPSSSKNPIIWLHMVSMGETRAMIPIYETLKAKYPQAAFYFSSTTATGHNEAKKNFPDAAAHFYLPLDHSFNAKRLVERIKPDLFLLSESDFWPNILKAVKKRGGHTILLNGKISKCSAKRFQKVPRFTKALFRNLDHLCVQNSIYKDRFASLGVDKDKLSETGNLKLSIPTKTYDKSLWLKKFNLSPEDKIITIGSTHKGEEELILKQIPKGYKILLAPRHPERFAQLKQLQGVILVEEMGILQALYYISDIAIVGGSFVPGIGGHNIFEPIQEKTPVIFGPYMDGQPELKKLILEAKAGIQSQAENLKEAIEKAPSLLSNVEKLSLIGETTKNSTLEALAPYLPPCDK